MRQRWVYVDGVAYECGEQPLSDSHHIIPDIEPFKSNDGAFITGRAHWREHLKRTDTVELGHTDIKEKQRDWQKRKEQFNDRLKKSAKTVKEYSGPVENLQRSAPTRLMVEMANRLHGRPAPERKAMIKLTLDIAKRMNRR